MGWQAIFLYKQLSAQGHSVTVIDQSSEDIKKINDSKMSKELLEEQVYQLS